MQLFQELGSYPDLGKRTKRRIAIISTDIKGPIVNGGVGTSNVALAEALAQCGHHVTLVFVNPWFGNKQEIRKWAAIYRKKGIRLIQAEHPSFRLDGMGPSCISYVVYLHLKENKYDIVHFADMHGVGYHAQLAKKFGLAFSDTLFCVTMHGPSVWHRENNRSSVFNTDLIQFDYLERASVEMADVLLAPSQSILQWALQSSWKLPKQVYVIPNPTSEVVGIRYQNRRKNLQEIVFFGRLELRKGLNLFCDALDRIPHNFMKNKKVTFLGCHGLIGTIPSKDYIEGRSKKWRFPWKIVSDLDQEAALNFLRSRSCLAVLPSTAESMGYTFIECLVSGIPLLANHLPSYKELLEPSAHAKILVNAADADQFAHAIMRLSKNSGKEPRCRKATSDIVRTWQDWHSRVSLPRAQRQTAKATRRLVPKVLVLNTDLGNEESFHCAREWEKQSYFNFIVARSGDFQDLLRLARETAADYLLFTNTKTKPYKKMIQELVRLAESQGSDVVTTTLDRCEVKQNFYVRSRQIGLGSDLNTGFFCNPFGSSDFLISRSAFLKLEEKHVMPYSGLDWNYLLNAGQQNCRIDSYPEPLGLTFLGPHESYFAHNLINRWTEYKMRFSPDRLAPLADYANLTGMIYAEMELHNSNRHHLGFVSKLDFAIAPKIKQLMQSAARWRNSCVQRLKLEWKLLQDRKLPTRSYWALRICYDRVCDFLRDYPCWPFRKLWWMTQYQLRKRLFRPELVEANDGT